MWAFSPDTTELTVSDTSCLMHFSSRTLIEVSCSSQSWLTAMILALKIKVAKILKSSNFKVCELLQYLTFFHRLGNVDLLVVYPRNFFLARSSLKKFFLRLDCFRWHQNTNGEPELDHELARCGALQLLYSSGATAVGTRYTFSSSSPTLLFRSHRRPFFLLSFPHSLPPLPLRSS